MSQLVRDWKTHTKEAALATEVSWYWRTEVTAVTFHESIQVGFPGLQLRILVLLHRASAVASTSPRQSILKLPESVPSCGSKATPSLPFHLELSLWKGVSFVLRAPQVWGNVTMLYIGSEATYLKPQQSGGDTSRVLLSVIPFSQVLSLHNG